MQTLRPRHFLHDLNFAIHVSSNAIHLQTTDCKHNILEVVFPFVLKTEIRCLFHFTWLADIGSGFVLRFELNLIIQELFELNLSLLFAQVGTFPVPQVFELLR